MTSIPMIEWGQPPVALPLHPRARTAMVLGIVSLAAVVCLLPALVGPLAWHYGAVARREIEREPARWGGRRNATIGMVCGIIGTALLVSVLLVSALVVGGHALLLTPQTGYGS
jgi:hypothetical protein